MCGRFTLTSTPEELAKRFDLEDPPALAPRYNVAPGRDVVAVRDERGSRRAVALRWGLVPAWAEDPSVGARMINARSETAATRSAFRDALHARRCLVPADGFFEWADRGGFRQPYYLRPAAPGPFGMAGLWERWRGRSGEILESCTVLTTEATPSLQEIHSRMPLVVPPAAYAAWLDPDAADAVALLERLRGLTPPAFAWHPVSPRVNRAEAEGADCIAPVEEPPRQEALF